MKGYLSNPSQFLPAVISNQMILCLLIRLCTGAAHVVAPLNQFVNRRFVLLSGNCCVIVKETRIIHIKESHDAGANTRHWGFPKVSQQIDVSKWLPLISILWGTLYPCPCAKRIILL